VGTGDAGELDRAAGAGDADGLDELNRVMIMAADAARTVTATSRTNPRPAMTKPFRREPGPGRWPAI
jgi:hypothetical protein